MGAIAGTIVGVELICEPFDGSTGRYNAKVYVTYPAYVASTDTTTVAGVGAAIAARRRDGKTVTLAADSGVCQSQSGLQGGVQFYNDTLTVSTDAINGELSDVASTEINAAAGVVDRPCAFIVAYTLT